MLAGLSTTGSDASEVDHALDVGARRWTHGNDCNLAQTMNEEEPVAINNGCTAVILLC